MVTECTLCEIKAMVVEKNQDFSPDEIDSMARNIYEDLNVRTQSARINELLSVSETEKSKADPKITECMNKKEKSGLTTDQARLACTPSKKKKETSAKNELLPAASDVLIPVSDPTLLEIKALYKEMRRLEYTPVAIYKDVQDVKGKINEYDSAIWDLEQTYKNRVGYQVGKMDIMIAKIQAQTELQNSSLLG